MNVVRVIRSGLFLLPVAALACVSPRDIESVGEAEGAVSLDIEEGGFSRAHMMPVPGYELRASAAPSAKVTYNFTYHGGPVISNVKVVTIFWGPNVPNQGQVNAFYKGITNSAHMDWLSEYNTPTQSIGRGTLYGSLVDDGAPAGDEISDAQIQREITRLIKAGSAPPPDDDVLYMLHFPSGASITMDGNRSCVQFCAYHGSFKLGGQKVYYGVMPDVSGGCASCGGTRDKLANTTIIASHELIESITDPGVGLANERNDMSYLAWYDDQHGEVGDVCEVRSGVVDGWSVQAEYSMVAGQCVIARAGAPAQAACDHGVCVAGGPLRADCGPCTQKVCNASPACCQSGWDASCIRQAVTICGKDCR